MTASIPRRLNTIKKIAKEYCELEYGALIEKHLELLRIFDIRGSKHQDHPHKKLRVYISRKALKHFIESRKHDLDKHHSEKEVTEIILFALDKIQQTITDFDSYEFVPPKHFYTKDYSHEGKSPLRILLDLREERLEIVSIHFRERKNK